MELTKTEIRKLSKEFGEKVTVAHSGLPKGVCFKTDQYRTKPYQVRVKHEGKIHCGGCFYTPEEAEVRAIQMRKELGVKERTRKCDIDPYTWESRPFKTSSGHLAVTVHPEHPYYSMGSDTSEDRERRRIYLHRLVIAKHLRRCLESHEHVHHVDGDPTNNAINNLWLFPSSGSHTAYEYALENGNPERIAYCKSKAYIPTDNTTEQTIEITSEDTIETFVDAVIESYF